MRPRRSLQVCLFLLALGAWCAMAVSFSPPHLGYRFLFFVACMSLGLATYWLPIAGWWLFLALIPLASMPSRALAFGAHEALSFLALAFGLGWWANRIVTDKPTRLPAPLAVPLLLIIATGITSGIWTALRYTDFYPLGADTFRNVWVDITTRTDAATAVRMVLIATAKYLVFPVVFWASFSILRERDSAASPWRNMVAVWAWALLPVFALVVYQSVFNPRFCMLQESAWSEAHRVSGGMTDPNALGLFLFFYLPLAAAVALKERGVRQVLLIASIVLGLYGVAQSGSRSALLGFLITVGIVTCALLVQTVLTRARPVRAMGAVLALLLVLMLAAPLAIPGIGRSMDADNPLARRLNRVWERSRFSPRNELIDRRETQWRQALAMWRDYPVAGIGMGAFPIEVPNYNRAAAVETPVDNAWNQYLHWAAEIGGVGLLFWLWFCVSAVRAAVRSLRGRAAASLAMPERVVLASLAAFLLLNIFGAHLHAAEVACVCAILVSVYLAGATNRADAAEPLSRQQVAALGLSMLLVCATQAYAASGPLSHQTLQKRYGLPAEFGLFRTERWLKLFPFQWTQKYAGKTVMVPDIGRVLSLKLAALDPDVSPDLPKRVKIWINNVFLDSISISTRQWEEHDLFVYDVPPGPAILSLECDRIWSPTNESPPRALGVALASENIWRSDMRREGQNLSPWLDAVATNTLPYRWTGLRVARMMAVGTAGVIKVTLRTPADVPFYREPVRVKVYFDNVLLKEITMPRDARIWTTEKVCEDPGLRNRKGILWLDVSRLSRVRVPGGVRRIDVGVAMAEIQTY